MPAQTMAATDVAKIAIDDQIYELRREIRIRERKYPEWSGDDAHKRHDFQRQLDRMRAALATLERVKAASRASQASLPV